MKKLLFSLAALAALTTVNAQDVIYFEDFDSATEDTPPAGWVFEDMDGDGHNFGDMYFVPDGSGQPATPVSLISRSWQVTALTPNNTATSPEIDLTSVAGPITLEWKVLAAAASWDEENYSVYVSESADPYDAVFEASVFSETYNDPANAGTQYTRTVDISSFAGKKVYVTFRHHDVTDMDYISIDDVTVKGTSDMAVSDLQGKKVSLFPNPTSDVFELKLGQSYDAAKVNVTIADLTGRKVKTFKSGSSYNVSDLAAGVYVVTVSDGTNSFTQKLIKK